MKILSTGLVCALLAGCATPVPPTTGTSPTPSPTLAHLVTPIPSPRPTISFTCTQDDPSITTSSPIFLPTSYCPAEEVAVETALAHVGFPIERIAIAPTVFPCGVPWPAGSPACPPFLELAAFVAFGGTDEVAVLTVALVPNGPVAAKQVAFQVPPAGWSMP